MAGIVYETRNGVCYRHNVAAREQQACAAAYTEEVTADLVEKLRAAAT
jgi:hypothetical protein